MAALGLVADDAFAARLAIWTWFPKVSASALI